MTSHTIYPTIICCCICCKEEKSHKGIHTHFLRTHSDEETKKKLNEYHKPKCITKQEKEAKLRREIYTNNPSKCTNCNKSLDYNKRKNKFCSSSCAAKVNNTKRDPRTEESKARTSSTIRKIHEIKYPKTTKIEFISCDICNNTFAKNATHPKGCVLRIAKTQMPLLKCQNG